jgi:hypothetical protein
MTSEVFFFGGLIFAVCLAVHIGIWRIKIPNNDALILFIIFLIIPSAVIIILMGLKMFYCLLPVSPLGLLFILLLHLSLSLVYVSSYPAAQAISPSLDILMVIAAAETKRMTEEEVVRHYNDNVLVSARINDLRTSILLAQRGDNFEVTKVGKTIIRLFILYRKIIGLPAGEG